ncbi:hypothetical protein [Aquisphaera giovannonii]|uniref:hypothetical protein n=1 Tax=Aquisphaera giovannonii TaxID=406548 RepID=UPI001FEA4D94|nr:hypothetical protein [Aquisphaera giovannonii]
MHLEATCGWCREMVLRATPCLFGLYSVVAWLYSELPAGRRAGAIEWPGKAVVTFSDALAAVRCWVWAEGVFARVDGGPAIEKLPPSLREIVYAALAPAA